MNAKPTDPYCFPGTNVLRNNYGILDSVELAALESLASDLAAKALYKNPSHVTDLKYLKLIHRTLFGKVYPWAGETRRGLGRMTKTRESGQIVLYGDCAYVDSELERMFGLLAAEKYLKGLSLEAFSTRAAYFYGELDAIHAFREGNSRTLRAFFFAVAHNAGFLMDWATLGATNNARQVLYAARDRAVMHGDSQPLAALFLSILTPLGK